MTVIQKNSNDPFLYDASTGSLVGVKQPDGTDSLFAFFAVSANAPDSGVKAELITTMTDAADIVVTAANYGAEGNAISLTYLDPAANSNALDVVVVGNDIKVYLATNSSGVITSTCAQVVAAINASAPASALVSAAVDGTGTEVAIAVAKALLEGGVTATPGNIIVKSDASQIYLKTSAQSWEEYSPTVTMTLNNLNDVTIVEPVSDGQTLTWSAVDADWRNIDPAA